MHPGHGPLLYNTSPEAFSSASPDAWYECSRPAGWQGSGGTAQQIPTGACVRRRPATVICRRSSVAYGTATSCRLDQVLPWLEIATGPRWMCCFESVAAGAAGRNAASGVAADGAMGRGRRARACCRMRTAGKPRTIAPGLKPAAWLWGKCRGEAVALGAAQLVSAAVGQLPPKLIALIAAMDITRASEPFGLILSNRRCEGLPHDSGRPPKPVAGNASKGPPFEFRATAGQELSSGTGGNCPSFPDIAIRIRKVLADEGRETGPGGGGVVGSEPTLAGPPVGRWPNSRGDQTAAATRSPTCARPFSTWA